MNATRLIHACQQAANVATWGYRRQHTPPSGRTSPNPGIVKRGIASRGSARPHLLLDGLLVVLPLEHFLVLRMSIEDTKSLSHRLTMGDNRLHDDVLFIDRVQTTGVWNGNHVDV